MGQGKAPGTHTAGDKHAAPKVRCRAVQTQTYPQQITLKDKDRRQTPVCLLTGVCAQKHTRGSRRTMADRHGTLTSDLLQVRSRITAGMSHTRGRHLPTPPGKLHMETCTQAVLTAPDKETGDITSSHSTHPAGLSHIHKHGLWPQPLRS